MPDNIKKPVRKLFEKMKKGGWTVLFYNPGAGDKALETLGVNPPECGMHYQPNCWKDKSQNLRNGFM